MNKSIATVVAVVVTIFIVIIAIRQFSTTPRVAPIPGGGELVSIDEVIRGAPEPRRRYKIGVLFPFLASPFWVNQHFGVISQAEAVGVDLVWLSADGYTNVSRQNDQIQDLLVQGIDGLIIAPTSFQGNATAISRVIERGIPVVVQVTDTSATGVASRVLADDYGIGKQQAEFLLERFPERQLRVAMISGPSGADWADNRARGFRETVKASSRVDVVAERFGEPERSVAQQTADDLLATFESLDAIYVAADGMAIGVATSVERAGRANDIIITTASLSRESLPYIRSGLIDLNVDESPLIQGRAAVNAMVHILNGQRVPERIVVPSPGFTAENLDTLDEEGQWAPVGYRPS